MHRALSFAIVPVLIVASADGAGGGSCVTGPQIDFVPDSPQAFQENFAASMAMDDILVVGAPRDDDVGLSSGSVYIYDFDGGWGAGSLLRPEAVEAGDQFGYSVDVHQGVIVAGARSDDHSGDGAGAAYVYDGAFALLVPDDGVPGDLFGHSVTVWGQTVAVGAYQAHVDGFVNTGAVYVFEPGQSGWGQTARLTPSAPAHNIEFGTSVDSAADRIVIGGPFAGTGGAAFVFDRDGDGWVESQVLTPDVFQSADDLFGWSVAISADGATIAVGGLQDDATGKVTVFAWDEGTQAFVQSGRFAGSDSAGFDFFGDAVDLSPDGRTLVVGAPGHDGAGGGAGAVYAFADQDGTWVELAKLTMPVPGPFPTFGQSVALGAGPLAHWAAGGAPGYHDEGSDNGTALVYTGVSDCNANGVLDFCDIDDGTSLDGNGDYVPDECGGVPCEGDTNGDDQVNVGDLLGLLGAWGTSDTAFDLDGDGVVNVADLLLLLTNWGPCR